ncbi:MAG TPA: NRDE family protein, partial [Candidatus Dormibacteraeota bacterium]|nr:NRDE family protein [Candidatus Dormibacteraeota bacterium]
MCTILIAWRCLEDAEFVVAANRDELVARPAAGPARLSEQPAVFGGRDLLAGGTWLAVRADGALAAVTNRRADVQDEVMRDPSLRSRGELPLAVLRAPAGARAALEGIRAREYNPFNLLVIDSGTALVGHASGSAMLRL